MKFRAIRIHQRGGKSDEAQEFLVGALPAGEILRRAKIDCVDVRENPDGYQRPLSQARVKEVAKYLREDTGVLPTSVLLSVRPDDGSVTFEVEEDLGYAEVGQAEIADQTIFWVVDGQHRIYGLERAIKELEESGSRKGEAALTNFRTYPVPVTILVAPNKYTEMRTFFVVNSRQKSVPTDVVDELLLQTREHEGRQGMYRRTGGDREFLRSRATQVVHALADLEGQPWYDRILLAGQKPQRGHYRIRQHAMVASLEPVMRDRLVSNLDDQRVTRLVANYWIALSLLMPEAFDHPDSYTVQKTPGVYVWHMVLPDVLLRCRQNDYSVGTLKGILAATGEYVTSRFWHTTEGRPEAWGSGMKTIRFLAESIREELPELRPSSLAVTV